jgi:hypothetical protein
MIVVLEQLLTSNINYTWWMLCFKEGRFCEEIYKEKVKEMGN